METRRVRLQGGKVIRVPADATEAEIDVMVREAEDHIRKNRAPRAMDQRIGTDSEQEEFDRYRPRLADEYVGEDWGRAIDAAGMGAGVQIRGFPRGFQNLNPFRPMRRRGSLTVRPRPLRTLPRRVTAPATQSPQVWVSLLPRHQQCCCRVACPPKWRMAP